MNQDMANECFDEPFIDDLAAAYSLNRSRLADFLSELCEEQKVLTHTDLYRAQDQANIRDLEPVLERLRKAHSACRKLLKHAHFARSEWDDIDPDTKRDLNFFHGIVLGGRFGDLSEAFDSERMAKLEEQCTMLADAVALLEAHKDMLGAKPGRPSLWVLREYALLVKTFWMSETGLEFGQEYNDKPVSMAAKFFYEIARKLDPRVTVSNCKQVGRQVQSGAEPAKFRKRKRPSS